MDVYSSPPRYYFSSPGPARSDPWVGTYGPSPAADPTPARPILPRSSAQLCHPAPLVGQGTYDPCSSPPSASPPGRVGDRRSVRSREAHSPGLSVERKLPPRHASDSFTSLSRLVHDRPIAQLPPRRKIIPPGSPRDSHTEIRIGHGRDDRQLHAAAARAIREELAARLRAAVGPSIAMDTDTGGRKRRRDADKAPEVISEGKRRIMQWAQGVTSGGLDETQDTCENYRGTTRYLPGPAATFISPSPAPAVLSPLPPSSPPSSLPSPPAHPCTGSIPMERSLAPIAPPNWRQMDREQKWEWQGWVSEEQRRQRLPEPVVCCLSGPNA